MSMEKSELNPGSGSGSDDVTRKITAILADLLEIDARGIQPGTKLEEDLGADSLLYLELFEELKDEFDLDIDMNSIQRYAAKHQVATVGEIAKMVRRYQTEGQAMLGEVKSEPAG